MREDENKIKGEKMRRVGSVFGASWEVMGAPWRRFGSVLGAYWELGKYLGLGKGNGLGTGKHRHMGKDKYTGQVGRMTHSRRRAKRGGGYDFFENSSFYDRYTFYVRILFWQARMKDFVLLINPC